MINLLSPSEDGIYKIKIEKGKEKKELIWERCKLLNTTTGEIISPNIMPKFQNYTYERYSREWKLFRFLEPMFAYEADEVDEEAMGNCIAETKFDGHRCLLHLGDGVNRAFSRRISKKTGWYNENTDLIPHIRDISLSELQGTVLDGEVTWGKNSTECQSVMGALPETAIYNQWKAKEWARLFCFDILYYKGINIQQMPLLKRKQYLNQVIKYIQNKFDIDYIELVKIYTIKDNFEHLSKSSIGKVSKVSSFTTLFNNFTAEGKEGIIIKDLSAPYEQGKRSKAFLKLKKHSTWDCVFMGLTEPEKVYTGKLVEEARLNEWKYWEYDEEVLIFDNEQEVETWMKMIDPKLAIPVTKPYAMGWCGGIRFGVYKPDKKGKVDIKGIKHILIEVGVAKGLTEEMMEELRNNWEEYMKEKLVVEIMAQEIIDKTKGSLRHPRFVKFREDKTHRECTWKNHIRE